jgi:hypothetical protein
VIRFVKHLNITMRAAPSCVIPTTKLCAEPTALPVPIWPSARPPGPAGQYPSACHCSLSHAHRAASSSRKKFKCDAGRHNVFRDAHSDPVIQRYMLCAVKPCALQAVLSICVNGHTEGRLLANIGVVKSL